ncbi:MAG: formylglycine-generating enzyme family protein [Oscillatoriales cyanobacterium C42_A2020_001]|nr:formylglycine-generating enzyme family protein [Leptolyngbyaceae cyanobacterium C42_A2020_001]
MTEQLLSAVEFDVVMVDEFGYIQERVRHSTKCWLEALGNGIELELVAIPGGTYVRGAPQTEEGWQPNQAPQQEVAIAPFWFSRTPITQVQWSIVAALPSINRKLSSNPSCFSGNQRPVEQVSWHDALEFCARLSILTNRTYRLPSEAEWEYACRAGTQTPFHFGDTITTDLANYSGVNWEYDGKLCSKGFYGKGTTGSDRRETTDVGSFGVTNAFGLYDMHGLVREWCADCWHTSYVNAPTDGSAWLVDSHETQRVLRGGSWNGGPRTCRSAFRSRSSAESNLYDIGFRVVREEGVEVRS